MSTSRRTIALLLASVAAGALGLERGDAQPSSRVVDRTFSCPVRGTGFPDSVRYLDVYGSARAGKQPPAAYAFTAPGGAASPAAPPSADSVGTGFRTRASAGRSSGAAWLNIASCSAARVSVAFTRRGLRGGEAGRFGESHRCDVPSRVLIRMRAVFTRPVTLQQGDRRAAFHLLASGRITSAAFAVATVSRQPIVYASVDDAAGRTTILTSPSRCFPT